MAQMHNNPPSKRTFGFTLLELLVVMAIIGILAAIGIASFSGVQAKARDARRKSDIESFARALEMFYNDNGRYPIITSADDMGSFGAQWTGEGSTWGFEWTVSDGTTYMSKIPTDPKYTNYRYNPLRVDNGVATEGTAANEANGYWIFAHLENEEDAMAARIGTTPARYVSGSSHPGLSTPVTATSCASQGCNYLFKSSNAPPPGMEAYP